MNKDQIIDNLLKIIPKKDIIFKNEELSIYNKDWRGFYNYNSICLIFPNSKKQISQILKFCFNNNVKVVPQAGNTSLTGASVPSRNNYEIIISLKKMNKILSIDKSNMLVEVESGVILDKLKDYVYKNQYYFPLSLSSSGSCLIGGNIATNAGGINALKYGSMRESIQGLEVILADGAILSDMSKMKKNNTGYDSKNLFCGSEGTLGIITKALLKIYPKPIDYYHCFFSFDTIKETINLFKKIRVLFNETLESAEIIPNIAFEITIKHGFLKKNFFPKDYNYYLLCKFNLFEKKEKYEGIFFSKIKKIERLYKNLIIAQTTQQEINFWKFRDDLVTSYKMEGKFITNDISLPLDKLENFIKMASKKLNNIAPGIRIYLFGHLGDGNIHFNIIEPINFSKNFTLLRDEIYNLVNTIVEESQGSFSAEHGIGMIKKKSLKKFKNNNQIKFMKNIKQSLDPKNILNPGKVIDLN
jgi:FAD/FMN-containing dehydrogenase